MVWLEELPSEAPMACVSAKDRQFPGQIVALGPNGGFCPGQIVALGPNDGFCPGQIVIFGPNGGFCPGQIVLRRAEMAIRAPGSDFPARRPRSAAR